LVSGLSHVSPPATATLFHISSPWAHPASPSLQRKSNTLTNFRAEFAFHVIAAKRVGRSLRAEARQPVTLPEAGSALSFLADVCLTSDPQQLQLHNFSGQIYPSASPSSSSSYISLYITSSHPHHHGHRELPIPFFSAAAQENSNKISSPCSYLFSTVNSLSPTTFLPPASILSSFLLYFSGLCFLNHLLL